MTATTATLTVSGASAGAGGSGPAAVCYLPTSEAYDRWSAVYDTDGNFLQKIDDIEMKKTLLPRLIAELRHRRDIKDVHGQQHQQQRGAVVVDLGCGTGRNTALLLSAPATDVVSEVVALDASRGMLDVARARLASFCYSSPTGEISEGERKRKKGEKTEIVPPRLRFEHHDLLATATPPACALATADAVISTLVVEHVPLWPFFAHAAAMLRPNNGGGGLLLLTNMHADMGRLSQAGFVDVDASTGVKVKVRPTSYAHTVAEVVEEAARWGFRVLDVDVEGEDRGEAEGGWGWKGVEGVTEVMVSEDMVEALGPRSRKWVGVTCWFGCLFKMDGRGEG